MIVVITRECIKELAAEYSGLKQRIAELEIELSVKDAANIELKQQYSRLQEARYSSSCKTPAPDREQIRREHAEWSEATFGSIGLVGPLKHLSKEALEAAADPSDSLGWADMQFLLWDAQRHMGISDRFITRAMIEKLAINKTRQWPEPKDGDPQLHIKEQPALVVPDVLERLRIIVSDPRALPRRKEWISGQQYSYVLLENVEAMVEEACRAAMLSTQWRSHGKK